jgi:hypothetical protein
MVYQCQSTQQLLTIIKQNRYCCVNIRFYLRSFFSICIVGGGIKVHSTLRPLKWPIVSAPGDYDNGEIGGMIGRGKRSTWTKPVPVPLCPPQIPHAARTRTRAAAVGSQRLTAELRHGLFAQLVNATIF